MGNNILWARTMMESERYGYRNVSDKEACLWEDIGDQQFMKVIDYGFRIAYWTAKHKELIPNSPEWLTYYQMSRKIAVEHALELSCDGKKEYIDLGILTDRQIIENCKKQLQKELKSRNAK